jgi:acyl-CoA thioester hydrolase
MNTPIEPALVVRRTVLAEWVDYNGHMGDFAYAIAFSQAVTAYMDVIGIDPAYRRDARATLYTLDLRIGYRKECHEGAEITLDVHVLDADAKRLHVYVEMRDGDGGLLAWNEQVLLHVSQAGETPRSAPFPPKVAERIAADARRAHGFVLDSATARPLGLTRT